MYSFVFYNLSLVTGQEETILQITWCLFQPAENHMLCNSNKMSIGKCHTKCKKRGLLEFILS